MKTFRVVNKDKWHTLTEIDRDNMQAICKQCGPVPVVLHSNGKTLACAVAEHDRGYKSNRRRLLRGYGITEQQYEMLLEVQGGVCAICKQSCPSGRMLAVDHDHNTGRVRGLLCMVCNNKLGHLENKDWIEKAMKYLGNENT
jgi:hypothetical protein